MSKPSTELRPPCLVVADKRVFVFCFAKALRSLATIRSPIVGRREFYICHSVLDTESDIGAWIMRLWVRF